jgi:hypothetical protein
MSIKEKIFDVITQVIFLIICLSHVIICIAQYRYVEIFFGILASVIYGYLLSKYIAVLINKE